MFTLQAQLALPATCGSATIARIGMRLPGKHLTEDLLELPRSCDAFTFSVETESNSILQESELRSAQLDSGLSCVEVNYA